MLAGFLIVEDGFVQDEAALRLDRPALEDGRCDEVVAGQGKIHLVEEVAQVEPLLTYRNARGEIEGVKYNQLSAVFINAIKEQQAQLTRQREQGESLQLQVSEQQQVIRQQQQEIAAIKKLLCRSNPQADLCKATSK